MLDSKGITLPPAPAAATGEFIALCLLRLELFMALGVLTAVAVPPRMRLCCHGQGDLLIRVLTWDLRNLDSVQTSAPRQLRYKITAVSLGRAPAH